MTTNMNEVIREIKEYNEMKKELDAQIEELKKQAIEYMSANGTDEVVTDSGKCTYRERISKRFATTEFKKLHKDLYDAFTTQTSAMYFTCN